MVISFCPSFFSSHGSKLLHVLHGHIVDFSKDLVVLVPCLTSSAQIAASNAVCPTPIFPHIQNAHATSAFLDLEGDRLVHDALGKRVVIRLRSSSQTACLLSVFRDGRSDRSRHVPARHATSQNLPPPNLLASVKQAAHMKQGAAAASVQQDYLTAVRGGKRQPTLRRSALTCSSWHYEAMTEDEETCHDIDTA